MTPAKRKAESKKDTPPAKKAKSEGEGEVALICTLQCQKLLVFSYTLTCFMLCALFYVEPS